MKSITSCLMTIALLAITGPAVAQVTGPAPSGSSAPNPAVAAPAVAPTATGATGAAGPVSTDINSIESLAWLHGCWNGTVNQRNFREQWSPVRAGMLIGASSTTTQGKVQDFEFLRIEQRSDGVFYVAMPGGKDATAFKLGAITTDGPDSTFSFSNAANEFPQEIQYRRASEGWLYATIQGTLKGQERKVIFPMRRIDCETGELVRQ